MKITALIILAMTAGIIRGQNNLEFSQTIFIELNGGVNDDVVETTIVVPEGKTWKIESAVVNSIDNNGYYNFSATFGYLTLNGSLISKYTLASQGHYHDVSYPVWLPAGEYAVKMVQVTCAVCTAQGFISALEFNIAGE